jgi:hypothetical protein
MRAGVWSQARKKRFLKNEKARNPIWKPNQELTATHTSRFDRVESILEALIHPDFGSLAGYSLETGLLEVERALPRSCLIAAGTSPSGQEWTELE